MKKISILLITVLSFTLLQSIVAQITKSDWEDDIKFLANNLPKYHKDFYKIIPKTKFDSIITNKLENIGNYNNQQLALSLMEILASLHVAHSEVSFPREKIIKDNFKFKMFPVMGEWFSDGFYITHTMPDYTNLLGKKLLKIDGIPISTILKKISKYISFENEARLRNKSPDYLLSAEILNYSDVTKDISEAEYFFDSMKSVKLNSISTENYAKLISLRDYKKVIESEFAEVKNKNYSFNYLDDKKIIYFQYNNCRDDKSNPFKKFNDSLFLFIEKNKVEKLVIDLRYNGGGNSAVLDPFINKIVNHKYLNDEGKFFALISNQTFSSALLNMLTLKRLTKVISIGDATGGKPNSWGEQKEFTLPNTKFIVHYCVSYFWDEIYNSDSYYPDIPVRFNFNQYLNGEDPVMDKVIEYESK